jgi:hypothetical protein
MAGSTPQSTRKRKANNNVHDDDIPALVSPAGETKVNKRRFGGSLGLQREGQQDLTSLPIATSSVAMNSSSPGSITDVDDSGVKRRSRTATTTASKRRGSPRRILFGDDQFHDGSISKSTSTTSSPSRQQSTTGPTTAVGIPITPLKTVSTTSRRDDDENDDEVSTQTTTTAKRRLLFGRVVNTNSAITICPPNVERVYRIVHKLTGSLGGNGSSGPIYGELTMHSMQKMVNWMIQTTGLNDSNTTTTTTTTTKSRFLDVGSGIGKPNLHVAQYENVEFSCGVEMEHSRYTLGMTCLKAVVDAAVQERSHPEQQEKQQQQKNVDSTIQNYHSLIQGKTMFLHKNILEAATFDPFTHVYMFSIGFPPTLWLGLSERWNSSSTPTRYLICYHGPKHVIDQYEFDVDLIAQTQTLSMHGSKEGHTAYIYRRTGTTDSSNGGTMNTFAMNNNNNNTADVVLESQHKIYCDPAFQPSYDLVVQQQQQQQQLKPQQQQQQSPEWQKRDIDDGSTTQRLVALQTEVNRQVCALMGGERRTTRSKQRLRLSANNGYE